MGGFGSGRYIRRRAKELVDRCISIDVNQLLRQRVLLPGQQSAISWTQYGQLISTIGVETLDEESILLTYHRSVPNADDWLDMETVVSLRWVPCHFGGERPWFLCPTCGRQTAKIILWDEFFTCRQCGNLAYASQRMIKSARRRYRSERIRACLGGKPDVFSPFPDKPKHLHLATYVKLMQVAHAAERAFMRTYRG